MVYPTPLTCCHWSQIHYLGTNIIYNPSSSCCCCHDNSFSISNGAKFSSGHQLLVLQFQLKKETNVFTGQGYCARKCFRMPEQIFPFNTVISRCFHIKANSQKIIYRKNSSHEITIGTHSIWEGFCLCIIVPFLHVRCKLSMCIWLHSRKRSEQTSSSKRQFDHWWT